MWYSDDEQSDPHQGPKDGIDGELHQKIPAYSSCRIVERLSRDMQSTAAGKPQYALPKVFSPQQHENDKDKHNKCRDYWLKHRARCVFEKLERGGLGFMYFDRNWVLREGRIGMVVHFRRTSPCGPGFFPFSRSSPPPPPPL